MAALNPRVENVRVRVPLPLTSFGTTKRYRPSLLTTAFQPSGVGGGSHFVSWAEARAASETPSATTTSRNMGMTPRREESESRRNEPCDRMLYGTAGSSSRRYPIDCRATRALNQTRDGPAAPEHFANRSG